jgi:uncharacterized lipoprotein YajG
MVWKKQVVLGVGVFLIAGCSDVKKTIGLEKTSPNSFSVNPYPKGLEVPPNFSALPTDPAVQNTLRKQELQRPLTPAEKAMMHKLERPCNSVRPSNKGNS